MVKVQIINIIGIISIIIALVLGTKTKQIPIKSNSRDIYELRLQRNVKNYNIKIDQKVSQPQLNCDKPHQNIFHNSSWSTQMCFQKDLSYTIEAAIGNTKSKKYEYINLQVDINQPWSWIKGKDCKSCEELEEYNFESLQNAVCNGDCKFQHFSVVQKYDPFKNKINKDQNKTGIITGMEEGILGTFFYDQLSFLAYNPNKNITVTETLKQKLSLGTYDALESLISIKKMKFLQAQKMINYDEYIGDGAIGLARLDVEYDSNNIQPDTHMLKLLLDSENELEQGDFVFGIYLNREGQKVQDYALTLGGYNAEYASEINVQDYFVNLKINKKKSNYQYVIPLKQISLFGDQFQISQEEGYLTMSTTLILLPLEIMNKIIDKMNKSFNMDCSIVDKKHLMIYCLNVIPRNYINTSMDFIMNGLTIQIPFLDMVLNCSHDSKSLFNQDISMSVQNKCLLKMAVSPGRRVILGEAFLNKRYTIFDIENNRIGFLPPQTVGFFTDEDEKRELVDLLIKIVTVVFVAGIISLYFIKNIIKCCNKLINFFGRLIDIQQLQPYKPRNNHNQFQQLDQKDGIEIQSNNSILDNSFNNNENKTLTVVPKNIIPEFKQPPQKRKIFEENKNALKQQQQSQQQNIQQNQPSIQSSNTPDLL